MSIISLLFPLIFTNNLVMSLIKFLAGKAAGTAWLRFMLGILSVVGIIAGSALTGVPVNFDSLSSLAFATIEAAALGILSHFSYKVITTAPSSN